MFELVLLTIGLALVFDFYNGMNDAANSIATIVSTRILTPRQAVAVVDLTQAYQPAAQRKMHARLQMGQVGHRHEQFPARAHHAKQFGQRPRLIWKCQVFEHVEAQAAVERSGGKGQFHDRPEGHPCGRIVGIDADDGEPVVELVHEHTFAAARIEDARAGRQRGQVRADDRHLGDVGRIELPGGGQFAVIVAAFRVFTRP